MIYDQLQFKGRHEAYTLKNKRIELHFIADTAGFRNLSCHFFYIVKLVHYFFYHEQTLIDVD